MSTTLRTNFNTAVTERGLSLTAAMNHAQIKELLNAADAAGCKLNFPAVTAGTYDEFVLAAAAAQSHTITMRAAIVGAANCIVTFACADAAGDTLACTNTAGAVALTLANTTDSKNTLTLIKAIIDVSNSSTLGTAHGVGVVFITGTASQQVIHGGTNDRTASAAGVAATGIVKSSTAGALASRVIGVSPSA